MNLKYSLGVLLLLLASFIWGIAYIPTRYLGSEGVSVFLELLVRYSFPIIIFGVFSYNKITKVSTEEIKKCMLTGLVLFLALALSVYGIREIEYGSMGLLLISLNLIFVPLYFVIVKKSKISKKLLIASLIAIFGIYLLTMGKGVAKLNIGAILCFLASFAYTAYIILSSSILSKDTHPITLHFYQSLTFVTLCLPLVLLNYESIANINWGNTNLYLAFSFIGLLAGTLAYQLFFYGQKLSNQVTTALVLSSQTVFSSLSDIIIFKITLTHTQIAAYIMITIAIFIVAFKKES